MALILHLDIVLVGMTVSAMFMLGLLAYVQDSASTTNRSFFAFAVITALWSIANYIQYNVTGAAAGLWAVRIISFLGCWHAYTFFRLCQTFPNPEIPHSRWRTVLGILATLVSVLTLTIWVFPAVTRLTADNVVVAVQTGPLLPLFVIYVGTLIVSSIVLFAYRTWFATHETKNQMQIVGFGFFVTFALVVLFNIIFPIAFEDSSFLPLSALFMFPTILAIAYAMAVYRLFSVTSALTLFIVYILTVFVLLEVLFSRTLVEVSFQVGLFIVVLLVGLTLIRSILEDVQKTRKIESLAEALATSNERLKQLDMQKSEFLSIATHQLRGPLAAIRGHLSLLLDGSYGAISEEAKKIIAKVFTSGTLMTETVNDFLNVSRIEQGSMQYEYTDFNVAEMVKDIVEELQPAASDHNLTLTLEGDVPQAMVHADYGKIRHIFFNLTDNAIKYTPQGWVKARVQVQPTVVRVELSDSGIGIAPDKIDTLFQKFVRMREATGINISGAGLGLYVAKQMVEAHNGKIWAESAGLGKGTTFVVELPLSTHEPKEPASHE